MCLLFESIRIEQGKVLNLDYHQKRVSKSSKMILERELNNITIPCDNKIYKLRISYDRMAIVGYSITEYIARNINSLSIVEVDSSFEYSLKYENRSIIDNLNSCRGNRDDILIVRNGYITDTSFSNILLFNGLDWHTPSTPLLEGTCRNRLLDESIIRCADIKLTDLKHYTKVMLINAMLDFDTSRTFNTSNIY